MIAYIGKPMRKTGVLTSGGDAPGMNAAIRAVTRTAVYKGMEVVGIRYGYDGLLKNEIAPLNALDVSGILFDGGSMLCSARCRTARGRDWKSCVIIKNNLITDMDITKALQAKKCFSQSLYEVSAAVAI